MNLETLYETLKKTNQAKEIYFNKDRELVMELLDSLVINKNRYGYMACPCRLASGKREADKDICCPCDYREADLEEFGACYCGLYVSKDVHTHTSQAQYVPERRPPEKVE
ncbi:MAG: ferredoxin:thioredoxin reductase [Desulfobacterales bacterium]|nr:ferredoxin:thioredoxin reductase [Desulfobacterales bacterium]